MSASGQLNRIFAARWREAALRCDQRGFTYGELYGQAAGMAAWISAQGCHAGDSVALRLPNGWPFAVAYLACLLGRYRIIPVNPELNPDDQTYLLERTQPRIVLEDADFLAGLPAQPSSRPAFDYPVGAVAAVFFTSGTTGRPKGVCHTLDALVGNVTAFNESLGLGNDTRLYHVLPMAYMAGFLNTLLGPWLAGGTVLLGPRFRPADALLFWKRPLDWNANAIWLTPTLATILARMNRDPEIARRVGASLRHVFCGTAPLPEATRRAFRDAFGCVPQESYGMSEVLLVAAQTRKEAEKETGVGRLLPGVTASFREAPEMNAEELVIHTPWALTGYLMEQGEGSPLLEDGGMPSGDLGELVEGHLAITGRLKDLIIRGGLNVSPLALEDVLLREPGLLEVAVVGLPHDFWGETIAACLVADGDVDTATLQTALQARCARELGEGMRPDRYVWLDALPRASTGKIQKYLLREQLA
ncbi:MAG: class I adenylate-forming enzyme family protein [Pseudomonadota bacterium]|nr:class I adenylate-forming enzyme family protein [Pseudomonadota bacterium]